MWVYRYFSLPLETFFNISNYLFVSESFYYKILKVIITRRFPSEETVFLDTLNSNYTTEMVTDVYILFLSFDKSPIPNSNS